MKQGKGKIKMQCIIGLLGLEFNSGNKGCSALAYAFLNQLEQIADENKISFEIIVITNSIPHSSLSKNKFIKLTFIPRCLKKPSFLFSINKKLQNCNIVFDFTEGDSFSDIYGIKRIFLSNSLKQLILIKNIPLVLGPQTYGPFRNAGIKLWSKYIIKKSTEVFCRDDYSGQYIYQITGRKIIESMDIAFDLPYKKVNLIHDKKVKVGVNPSALLWSGGYTGNNQFSLKTDYKEYCISILEYLCSKSNFEVHLIPHVIVEEFESRENDVRICKILNDKFINTIVAPSFQTPMEAKSYISGMDILIGARMHATIAAFSSGVATIPFSYSRKFEGLYDSLDYPYVISARSMKTEEAIKQTIEWIEHSNELRQKVEKASDIIQDRLNKFQNGAKRIIISLSHERGKS